MHQGYVANGSRYQAEICWKDSEADEPTTGVVDVGDIYPLPLSVKILHISLDLQDEKQRQILKNEVVNDCKAVIITEEGTITYGYKNKDKDDSEWMWKSSLDGTETYHKPKKCFVANASGKEIVVQLECDDGRRSKERPVHVAHRETGALEHGRVRITCTFKGSELVIFRGTLKPRTSLVVCYENTLKTGKLYGEAIEDKKWIVDGRDYKPESTVQKITTFVGSQLCGRTVAFFGDNLAKMYELVKNTKLGARAIAQG